MESAQFAIMSGDDKWIGEAITECSAAGVPQNLVSLLVAEQHLIQGRLQDAITALEYLGKERPECITGRAMLAIAHDISQFNNWGLIDAESDARGQ